MNPLWLALVVPWLVALVATPLTIRLAQRKGWVDRPSERKRHTRAVPLLGGVAVFGSTAAGLGLAALWVEPIREVALGAGSLAALGLGVTAVVGLGLYDDLRDLRPGTKALAQIAIAIFTWVAGFRCGEVELPFGWVLSNAGPVSLLLTVGWLVLVTNAFNLLDGVDGLAAGTGIAASLTVVILGAEGGATVAVMGSLALAGSLAAFLRFNLPPARIFLGDAGALAIGYTLAALSLASYQKSPTAVVLVVPLVALGLPLVDTLLAISRRSLNHLRVDGIRGLAPRSLLRAIMAADRSHIHHLLERSGWSTRSILFVLYGVSASLSAVALWSREASAGMRWGICIGLVASGTAGLLWLDRHLAAREAREAEEAAAHAPEQAAAVPRRAAGRSA